jgi:tRNA/rRNA methyltransferase
MRNEDVYRCHVCLSIPTAPAFGSLNLAAAVQLIAYDWRQALGGFALPAAPARPAGRRHCRGRHAGALEQALVAVDFWTRPRPRS